MSFVHTWVLLLIPLLLWLLRRRRSRTSVAVPSIQLWPNEEAGKARYLWLPIALRRVSIVLILVALARPQAGSEYNLEVTEGIDSDAGRCVQ
ncbi:MAG: BatA domain-containing protein [Coraliomargarita sp.]